MRNRMRELKNSAIRGTDHSEEIKEIPSLDFSKIKIGNKTLDDAILNFGDYKRINPRVCSKKNVYDAINNYDLREMRDISLFFYRTSGIYKRMVNALAGLYRWDWYITPYINSEKAKEEEILKNFHSALSDLDNFHVKKVLGEIALKVVKNGAYYAYKVETEDGIVLQELPANFCRTKFSKGSKLAVEFNMRYFDQCFLSTETKMKVLKMFPKEFAKGYILYKQGKLMPEYPGDINGWYLLDVASVVKFSLFGEDFPPLISVIPLILDLDEGRDMDKERTAQRLLKLIIQKLPLDKNGDMIFDMDESAQLHDNAVQMVGSRNKGLKVLTTFADTEVATLSDTGVASSQTDDLDRETQQIYNDAGLSLNLFNANGNLALDKSVATLETVMSNLLYQFEVFLNELLVKYNKNKKKVEYKVSILTTTVYNYKDIAKIYKEYVGLGYSKILPLIAMGHSQSSILASAYFENDILDLVSVFVPPVSSNNMNASAIKGGSSSGNGAGRPAKEDGEKSTKTIQNQESMS